MSVLKRVSYKFVLKLNELSGIVVCSVSKSYAILSGQSCSPSPFWVAEAAPVRAQWSARRKDHGSLPLWVQDDVEGLPKVPQQN